MSSMGHSLRGFGIGAVRFFTPLVQVSLSRVVWHPHATLGRRVGTHSLPGPIHRRCVVYTEGQV